MFKKPLVVQNERQLSGKDVKALKKDIQKQFDSLTEENLASFLISKQDVTILKLSGKIYVFICKNVPIFIEVDGVEKLVPTVFLLWLVGNGLNLPMIHTHSLVSPKVLQGADLMLPGNIWPSFPSHASVHGQQVYRALQTLGSRIALELINNMHHQYFMYYPYLRMHASVLLFNFWQQKGNTLRFSMLISQLLIPVIFKVST